MTKEIIERLMSFDDLVCFLEDDYNLISELGEGYTLEMLRELAQKHFDKYWTPNEFEKYCEWAEIKPMTAAPSLTAPKAS